MGETASERVVVLGAGRVATHLVPALIEVGYSVQQVWSRTEVSACELAKPLGIPYTDDFDAVMPDADIYIACVADGALPEVAARVVAHANKKALFLHTAGSVDMSVWQGCGAVSYGILYPLQTFSKERAVDMHNVSLFVEASDEEASERVEDLAHKLSARVFRADSKCRAQLHVAAVFACNFTNAMYDVAHGLLSEEGIPFDVLLPLIDETAAKVHTLTPRAAQTGPAVRGDCSVIQGHLKTLNNKKELYGMYSLISDYIEKQKHER